MGNEGGLRRRNIPHLPLVIVQDHQDPHRLLQHIDLDDLSETAVLKLHRIALLRHLGIQVRIGVRLIELLAQDLCAGTFAGQIARERVEGQSGEHAFFLIHSAISRP